MADQCAIRSEWDNIQAANFVRTVDLPGDRPEQVGGPSEPSGKRHNPISASTCCKAARPV
jgi:hypothetical protein